MEDPNIPDYAAKKVERLYLLLSELAQRRWKGKPKVVDVDVDNDILRIEV